METLRAGLELSRIMRVRGAARLRRACGRDAEGNIASPEEQRRRRTAQCGSPTCQMTESPEPWTEAAFAYARYDAPFHLAMAQATRWFQVHERGQPWTARHQEILAPDFRFESGASESGDREAYLQRLLLQPRGWRHAHHILAAAVRSPGDGTALHLHMDVVQQNLGRDPNGALLNTRLRYDAVLKQAGPAGLPQLARLRVAPATLPVPSVHARSFIDTYARHRLESLAHRFFSLADTDRLASPAAAELLARTPRAGDPDAAILHRAALEQWLGSFGQEPLRGRHGVERLDYRHLGDQEYYVILTLRRVPRGPHPRSWDSALPMRQEWIVRDEPAERFARIASAHRRALV